MPRQRMIKPEFLSDEITNGKFSPWARLAYIGSWILADDEGRLRGGNDYLHSNLFPYDRKLNFQKVKDELIESRKWLPYEVNKEQFLWIPAFILHQSISHPYMSRLPAPSLELLNLCSLNVQGALQERSRNIPAPARVKSKSKSKSKSNKEIERKAPPDGVLFFSNLNFPENLNTEKFKSKFNAWLDWRIAVLKKRQLKPETLQRQVDEMGKWGEEDAVASIEHSMRNEWQGLFRPKGKSHGKSNANGAQGLDADWAEYHKKAGNL